MPVETDLHDLSRHVRAAVDRDRLLKTAVDLIGIRSITGDAGKVSDALARMLEQEGFSVERPAGGHAAAPAVAARWSSGRPGPVLQFDGHLDTVHLPFVPPTVEGDLLKGSGASDMKAGVAAAVEALRVIRDNKLLPCGEILFTAHDLHEAPWGDGSQLNRLIEEGYCGDAALIPEYTRDSLPIIGRGNSVFKLTVRRPGAPIHEVYRPLDQPSPLKVIAELAQQLEAWGDELARHSHPMAGKESLFLGQMHVGEIYNQFAQEGWLEGTRRWLPGRTFEQVKAELDEQVQRLAARTGAEITVQFQLIRDAFELPVESQVVTSFQQVCREVMGEPLPVAAKPFVDDGSSFWALKKVPCITHGPRASGAHTLSEWVSIEDLCRVAQVYALTAWSFCSAS